MSPPRARDAPPQPAGVPPDVAARPPAARVPRDLRVRPPSAADAGALLALVAACDRTYLDWAPSGWTLPAVLPDWPRQPGRWSLCALRAGEMAAYASFRPARRDESPGRADGPPLTGVAQLAALYVHPSCWRQGIGAAMLASAEAAMQARGYGAGRLWTPENAPAERFYAARGWRRDGRSGWDGWLGLQMVGYATRL